MCSLHMYSYLSMQKLSRISLTYAISDEIFYMCPWWKDDEHLRQVWPKSEWDRKRHFPCKKHARRESSKFSITRTNATRMPGICIAYRSNLYILLEKRLTIFYAIPYSCLLTTFLSSACRNLLSSITMSFAYRFYRCNNGHAFFSLFYSRSFIIHELKKIIRVNSPLGLSHLTSRKSYFIDPAFQFYTLHMQSPNITIPLEIL